MTEQDTTAENFREIEDPLRYTFVEMLFALAVGQIAIHTADFLSVETSPMQLLPAAMHLVVSLLVIGTSWIGWRQSMSPGMKQQIQSIFSRRAIGLLLDVLLVILYFILVRSVELQQKDGNTILTPASARPEAKWLACVFCIYIVWDLLADVFSPNCLTKTGLFGIAFQALRVGVVSVAASVFCLGMTLLVLSYASEGLLPIQVVLLDCALMMIVVLFRVLKVFEPPFAKLVQVQDCHAFIVSRSGPRAKSLTALFIGAYGAFIFTALHWPIKFP